MSTTLRTEAIPRLPRWRSGFFPDRRGDEVVLTALRRGIDVVIRDPDQVVWDMLDFCDGRHSPSQIAAELDGRASPAQVERMLSQLAAAEVLVDASGDSDDESTNVRVMLESFGGDPGRLFERLRAGTVLVLGCGGVGSWAAITLAAHHVGTLRLVDPDVVERTNLGRQAFRVDQIGGAKVDALSELAQAYGNHSRLEPVRERATSAAEIAELARGCDFVVISADEPSFPWVQKLASTALVPMGVPHIACGYNGAVLRCGPTWQGPGSGACCACPAVLAQYVDYELEDEEKAWHQRRGLTTGTTSVSTQIAASFAAQDAIHVLAGAPAPHRGVMAVTNLSSLEITRFPAPADPDCPVCGDGV